jgi:ATP-dependent Clp protease ATP-binding subunit ClpA
MFERFTERARQVIVLAQDEARALKHNYIGTEHLLLGLLREEEGVGCRVLESLDLTVGEVRGRIAKVVGEGENVETGQIPFTPRSKKVLDMSLREALSLGHNYVGTEHILLALVRENEGVAARILNDFDVAPQKIRDETVRMLGPVSGLMPPSMRAPEKPADHKPGLALGQLIELVEAAQGILPFVSLSTENARPSSRSSKTAEQLRRDADDVDKKDEAVKRFRKAIQQFQG